MRNKKERLFTIKQIVQSEEISNQRVFLDKLKERGFRTTQATLSRDLHELGIVRVPTPDGFRYVISEEEGSQSFGKFIGMEILGIYYNENLLIIRTLTARAKGVAYFIDQLKHPNIMATVAGENAIIVVPDTVKNLKKLKTDLEKIASQQ